MLRPDLAVNVPGCHGVLALLKYLGEYLGHKIDIHCCTDSHSVPMEMARSHNLIPFEQIEEPAWSTSKGNAVSWIASWIGKPWVLIKYIVSYDIFDPILSELIVGEETIPT